LEKISAQSQEFTIKGKMELHGKSKDISVVAKIRKVKDAIEITSNFALNPEDFDIKIPSVVKSKVAKKVDVRLDFMLQ